MSLRLAEAALQPELMSKTLPTNTMEEEEKGRVPLAVLDPSLY